MQYGAESSVRLEELEGYEARALALDADRKQAVSELRIQEQRVGDARRKAAPLLAKAVQQRLRELAMPHAVLDVHVANDSGDVSRDAAGDGVVFLLAANPGTEALPLTKVASGGELARTMLALRLVLTEGPHSLVFDEVDAGIGGEAAVAVAQALSDLGKLPTWRRLLRLQPAIFKCLNRSKIDRLLPRPNPSMRTRGSRRLPECCREGWRRLPLSSMPSSC